VFVGSYALRLDEKGRLALPVRFRDQVAGGMVIKKGQERCIYGLTMARVAEQSAAMAAMAPSDTAGARMAARMSFGSMVEIEPDKTGRITIPASLREYAGLDRDVVIVGVDTRFEIWDAANWDAYVAEQEAMYAEMESEGMPTLS
jgi:MraZ protein